jgi:predicted protein tyrosine phosphatase
MIVMGTLAMIFVCNLHDMPTHVGVLRLSHLDSLVTSTEQPPMPDGTLIERHLRIEIDDITEPTPGAVLPERHHVENLIEFMRVWEHDDDALLIHSLAGVSRSMASALIALVLKAGGRQTEAAHSIRAAAPHAIRTAASSRWPTRSSGSRVGSLRRARPWDLLNQ